MMEKITTPDLHKTALETVEKLIDVDKYQYDKYHNWILNDVGDYNKGNMLESDFRCNMICIIQGCARVLSEGFDEAIKGDVAYNLRSKWKT